jgi:hypothetical protein
MKKRLPAFTFAGVWLAALVFAQSAQDLKAYEYLKEPRIRQGLPPQKMLVVEAKGNPNVVGQEAFGRLFKVFSAFRARAWRLPGRAG